MTLIITDTNPETTEEIVLETVTIDISGFVYPEKANTLSWTFDNL